MRRKNICTETPLYLEQQLFYLSNCILLIQIHTGYCKSCLSEKDILKCVFPAEASINEKAIMMVWFIDIKMLNFYVSFDSRLFSKNICCCSQLKRLISVTFFFLSQMALLTFEYCNYEENPIDKNPNLDDWKNGWLNERVAINNH